MKLAINDHTGLPETPDGHWWRVTEGTTFTERGVYIYGSYRGDEIPCVNVSLMTRTTELRQAWFIKFRREVEMAHTTLPVRQEIRPGRTENGWRYGAEYEYTVNAETILATAEKIMGIWHAEQETIRLNAIARAEEKRLKGIEDANRQRYLGDYPPKRLVREIK